MPDYGPRRKQPDINFEQISLQPLKKFLPPIIMLLFIIITGYSACYTVKANEEAVVLRFGKYKETVGPGLHTKIPYGIDKILKGEVKSIYNEEFGFRTEHRGSSSMIGYEYPEARGERLMLTGDINSAEVHWVIRYKIKALEEYFFNVRNVGETIRDVSQAAMRNM